MKKPSRNKLRLHRKRRARAKISGTPERPRLAVFKSLKQVYLQVIDDTKGATLLTADTRKASIKNSVEGAKELGKILAAQCAKKNIKELVFDRSGYPYQGKVKAAAEGLREGGMKL